MTRWLRIPVLPLLFVANVLAGAWLLGQVGSLSEPWVPPPALRSADIQIPEIRTPASGSPDRILARPLFWESRRPISPPEPAVVPERDTLSGLRLLGTIGGSGGGVLYRDDENGVGKLAIGERSGAWRLVAVDGDAATFERDDGETRELRLQRTRVEEETLEPPARVQERPRRRDAQ